MRSNRYALDEIGLVDAQQAAGPLDLGHVEGQVRVGVEHEIALGLGETGLDRSAELAVLRVVDDSYVRVGVGQLICDAWRGVGRRVVDDQDLVVGDLAVIDQHPLHASRAASTARLMYSSSFHIGKKIEIVSKRSPSTPSA